MSSNTLGMEARLKKGKAFEETIFHELNKVIVKFDDFPITRWEKASDEDDIYGKIDAYAFYLDDEGEEVALNVSFKYREVGCDLGIAAYRPYSTHGSFHRDWFGEKKNKDRDMKHIPDLFVSLGEGVLAISPGIKVYKAVNMMLEACASDDYAFNDRKSWASNKYPHAQLRLVTDKGGGYSLNQRKIICYLEPEFTRMIGGQVFHV